MSITDELREYASTRISPNKGMLLAIADRIDVEHERECKEQYACGAEHGIGASIDASMIQTHGYVELPVDADGEYIHIGDVLTDDAEFKSEGNVECLMFDESGWMVGFGKGWTDVRIHEWHHYHAPTVEDVLREFALAVCKDDALTIREGVVEEFAKRLTLAEGEDA